MIIRKILVILTIFSASSHAQPSITIGELFRNSFRVYEEQRNEIGVYRDSTVFSGDNYHPGSSANVGIGLISLCIADSMKWYPPGKARDLALQTLETMAVGTEEFFLERNKAGVLRHFFDLKTGAQAWNSEYSTIDTAIYMSGALFAKNYFNDETISHWVDRQYREIAWDKMIADPATGSIYRELDAQGNGITATTSPPFNEYMLVAHLAYQAEFGAGGPATDLWNNFFSDPSTLPKIIYANEEQLTDRPGHFISHFIQQFCYYLCPAYTNHPGYLESLGKAMRADRSYFAATPNLWGLGAGETPTQGYRANHLGDNSDQMVSPAIVGGFVALDPEGCVSDLLENYKSGKGVYKLNGYDILWRHSLAAPTWTASSIHGIDHSTMLFGLATLPQHCGRDFFLTNNDYLFPTHVEKNLVKTISTKEHHGVVTSIISPD